MSKGKETIQTDLPRHHCQHNKMIKIVFRYLVCDLFGDNTRNTRFNTELQNLLRYQTSAGCSDTTSLESQTQRIILYDSYNVQELDSLQGKKILLSL